MNIHGYKLKLKNMTRSLKFEESKNKEESNTRKIKRLISAKSRCSNKIKQLKQIRGKKHEKIRICRHKERY